MSDDPYCVDDREHPHDVDVADDTQMLDLMWRTGHALSDMVIWLRDHSDDDAASAAWGEEADGVASAMEDAAVADRSAQWEVYGRFAARRDEVERIIEHQLAQHSCGAAITGTTRSFCRQWQAGLFLVSAG